MTTVSLKEAEGKLSELVRRLGPGEEVVLTENDRPVAKLVGQAPPARKPRQPGSAKGLLTILAEDDEHLRDFTNYMP